MRIGVGMAAGWVVGRILTFLLMALQGLTVLRVPPLFMVDYIILAYLVAEAVRWWWEKRRAVERR